jgi:type VI secretion system protein ImpJ
MFLRPQQLQAAQRYEAARQHTATTWDHSYYWGLRAVTIDPDALSNHRLVIHALEARLRDGTLVRVPEEGALAAVDLKPALERERAVTVSVAVPVFRLGQANAGAAADGAEAPRYLVDTQELEDENTGLNPQPVAVRQLNLRLLLSGQDPAGYELLPVARIERSPEADALPRLEAAYIPPVLVCGAWHALRVDILQAIYDRVGKKIELLAGQVVSRGIAVGSQTAADALITGQLRVLNEAYALLGVMAFAQVHPLPAYLELCRLVGQLAIYGEGARPPELPRYDHDDLGGCFYRVKQYIDALLDRIVEPEYKQRPFEGAGLRMQVPLEPSWLEPAWQMYVGVKSPLPAEEAVRLLTRPGQLDMKIGSSDRVDRIYQLGQAGLKFTHIAQPPRALPAGNDLVYLQVSRESQQEEWQNVQRSLTLAIRLNEARVVGNIQGQRVLTIRTGPAAGGAGPTATLQFTLYVVRPT